jgi:hypothetical protein
MKKKGIITLLILSVFIFSQNCYSISIKSNKTQIEKTNNELNLLKIGFEKLKSELKNSTNSQQLLITEISNLKIQISNSKETKSIYSTLLTVQTGIFSVIIAISIFIVGFILPKSNEKKYRELLETIRAENQETKNDITSAIRFLDMIRLKNEKSNYTGLITGFSTISSLLKKSNYTNAKRINIVLSYINTMKSNVTNDLIDKGFDEFNINYKELLVQMKKNEFIDIYNDNLEKFVSTYK